MHHLAGLARLDDHPHPAPGVIPDQVVVNGGGGEQRGNGGVVGVDVPVGEDQHRVPLADLLRGQPADPLQPLLQRLHPAVGVEGGGDGGGRELALGDVADRLQVGVAQDRGGYLQPLGLGGPLLQQVAPRPEAGRQGHDQLLADRVDGRVGHLGEELLEVREKVDRALAENRQRGVVSHRADRLLAIAGHRGEDELQLLLGIAEGAVPDQEGAGVGIGRLGDRIQLVETDGSLADPLPVGVAPAEHALDGVVVQDLAGLGVDQEQPARLQPPLLADALLGDRQHPGLGGHHHPTVLGDQPAGRAEAVAVEGGADQAAVGEGDGGGAVPGLDERGVELVEGVPLLVHERVPVPGLGDHHHDRVLDRATGHGQQLERVVELARVRPQLVDHRAELADVGAVVRAAELRLAGPHPVDVAAQRVDLAVVRAEAEGLGQVPPGQDVGGEAGVDHGEPGDGHRVAEVRVEGGELVGGEHPLVDERAAAEARNVEAVAGQPDRVTAPLDDPPEDVEAALQGVALEAEGADEEPADDRHPGQGGRSGARRLHRDVAPAEQPEPLVVAGGGDQRLAVRAGRGVLGEEDHPHPVGARRREREAGVPAQNGVGELDQDAGAVAAQRVRTGGTAVAEVAECLQAGADDLVGRLPVQRRHEGDPAVVVVQPRIVQAPHPVRVAEVLG